ncbi:uncharacterized protein [Aquarana catesbeiana]
MLNLKFYQNEIPFEPYGVRIDDLHKYWKFDYCELESNHSYIQWLFPLREPGMNNRAKPLTEKEMEEMKKDEAVMQRLLQSYKLMLGFYGIELVDSKTGKVARADNWKERFSNLNTNTHNNLKITRILKCLGELGYERYQVPLVKFFLKETLCHGNLKNVKTSALNYFMFTVKNKSERRELVLFAWEHYEPKEKFTWGPMETLRKFKPPAPVEKPDNESESMDIEYEDKRFQKNGRSKDDSEFQNKARECEQENKGAGKSHWLKRLLHSKKGLPTEFGSEDKMNGKQPMQSGAVNDKDYKGMESESVDSKEKEGTPIDSMSGNDKENRKTPTMSYSGIEKVNKESPIESRSEGDKENKETPTESREDNENEDSQVESESEDKRKGGPPMRSGLNDDIEKRGSPTEFGSEDKVNGEQLMQSGAANDKDNKGPPTESESVDSEEKKGAPMDCVSDNDKENKKPPTDSGSEDEQENGAQSMQSGAVDDKSNTLPPT